MKESSTNQTRPVVVLASILKPINDTRMYEKLAISLGQTNKYAINIIGFPTIFPSDTLGITFLPLPFFKRISFKRLVAPLTVLYRCLRLRPALLIMTTHELLLAGLLCRCLCRTRLVYDIQENYALNIRTQQIYPHILSLVLAGWIRMKERFASRWIASCLLAETIYTQQLPFLQGREPILPNLSRKPLKGIHTPGKAGKLLLFSGTIAAHTGIWEAIHLTDLLHKVDPAYHLHIEGYCAHQSLRKELMDAVTSREYVSGNNFDQLSDHSVILDQIRLADIGLLPYQTHPSTAGLVPTKLYEYHAFHLPMLLPPRKEWESLISSGPAGITVEYADPDIPQLIHELETTEFYMQLSGEEMYWETVEKKFLSRIDQLFSGETKRTVRLEE